jgi:hypothetical protein
MEEEDIDTWYEEQKDKFTEKYRQKVDKAKTEEKEKLKNEYLKHLGALRAKYENISKQTSESNLKRFFFSYRLNVLKEKLMSPFTKFKQRLDDRKKRTE